MGRASRRCSQCCRIESDDFDRPDADDPGNYTEVGGSDYDVSGNELLCATGGLLICDTVHPRGDDAPQRVKRRFKRSSTGQHARVVLAYTDASNYLYASVETVSGCDVLRLFAVVAGTPTEVQDAQTIGDGAPTGAWHTLEACLKHDPSASFPSDVFRAKVTLASGKVYGSQADAGIDFAGGSLGGIDDSAGVRCDDFHFGWMPDETVACKEVCPDCGKFPCLIENDDFPGGSETACKWSGSTFRVFDPTLATDHCVTSSFSIASGESATVYVNRKGDGSDYLFATLSRSGNDLTLGVGRSSTSVTETVTMTSPPAELPVTMCVCSFSGSIFACVSGYELRVESDEGDAIEQGYYAGRSGTVAWDSFAFSRVDPDCPPCGCGDQRSSNCCDPPEQTLEHPEYFLLRVEGIVSGENDDGPCFFCPEWNGNRLVKRSHVCDPPNFSSFECWTWGSSNNNPCGGLTTYQLTICKALAGAVGTYPDEYVIYQNDRLTQTAKACDSPATYLVSGTVGQGGVAAFWTRVPHTLDPVDFVDLEIPIGDMFTNSAIPGNSFCRGPGAKMFATAIQ